MTVQEETRATDSDTAEAAFGVFFSEHHARLYRALVMVTRSPHEADEITQEAFVRIWAKWDRVSGMESPDGYLYRAALNLYRQRGRQAARLVRLLASWPGEAREDALDRLGELDTLQRLVLQLPPRQRAALVVTEYLGYDSAAGAEILGIQPGAVRMLVSKAKAQLREEGMSQ
ncbi:MAG TPA: sigma-70 family RNA polymerase sigma factor [Gaiellaceae bacterium]|jgi:RNA polymerase sigma factor (sigma-70 family)|nr:sigma-70 family RNA polymerase sigma factor [Gaiellaceae bacterium]